MNTATPLSHPGLYNTYSTDRRTTEPVTVSGWYEHTDGSAGYYQWCSGRLSMTRSAGSWEEVRGEA